LRLLSAYDDLDVADNSRANSYTGKISENLRKISANQVLEKLLRSEVIAHCDRHSLSQKARAESMRNYCAAQFLRVAIVIRCHGRRADPR